MAFPTDDQLQSSRFVPLDAPDLYVATYGEAKTYTTYTEQPGVFEIFLLLTTARRDAWLAHYDSNKTTADTFVFQQESPGSYQCYYDGPPQSQRVGGNHLVTVRLRKAT